MNEGNNGNDWGKTVKKDPHLTNENFKGSSKIFTKLKHRGPQRSEEMTAKASTQVPLREITTLKVEEFSLFGLPLDRRVE